MAQVKKHPIFARLPLVRPAGRIRDWRKAFDNRVKNIEIQNSISEHMKRREIRSELQRLEGLLSNVHPALRDTVIGRHAALGKELSKKVVYR
jgi:hypothetical protein